MMKNRLELSQSLHTHPIHEEGAPLAILPVTSRLIVPGVTPVSPQLLPLSISSILGTQAHFSLLLPLLVSLKVMMRTRTSKTMRKNINMRKYRSLTRRKQRKRGGHGRAYLFHTGTICSTRTSQLYWKWSPRLYCRTRCFYCWCLSIRRRRDKIELWVCSPFLIFCGWFGSVVRDRAALVVGDFMGEGNSVFLGHTNIFFFRTYFIVLD